jgi:hypothetical protein
MPRLNLLLMLLALAGACHADTFEPALRLTLPDEVAGLSLGVTTRSVRKEEGVNYGWMGPASQQTFGSLTVYVSGAKVIPNGIESPTVRNEFDKRIAKIERELPLRRGPEHFGPSEPRRTTYAGCGPQFLWTAYTSQSDEGVKVWSIYLVGMNGHFVDVATEHLGDDETGAQTAERFVQEMRKVLGRCK